MFKNIIVSSIFSALDDAKEFRPTQVISFLDTGHTAPNFNLPPQDHLIFTDVEDTDRWDDEFAPSMRTLKSILDFVKPDSRLLVHCIGGISRSTATAISLMVKRGASVDEAVQATFAMRPNFWPNAIIIDLFDAHMFMGGEFAKACRDAHNKLDKRMQLWCDKCRQHFFDGDNCAGKHW